jgi:hypothetical protein
MNEYMTILECLNSRLLLSASEIAKIMTFKKRGNFNEFSELLKNKEIAKNAVDPDIKTIEGSH